MYMYLYKKKIPALDVVRAFATLQIVLFHFVCASYFSDQYVLLWGREGVAMFFMISGAGLINKYYYNFSVKDFYRKRVLSIYIPFWICYCLVFIWHYFWNSFQVNFNAPIKNIWLTVFGIDGIAGVYGIPTFYQIGEWYLGILLLIYIVFPIWRIVFIKSPSMILLVTIVLRIIIINNNVFAPLPVCFNPITALSNFTFGAYGIYVLKTKRETGEGQRNSCVRKVIILSFSLLIVVIGWILGHKYGLQDYGEIMSAIGIYIILWLITPYLQKGIINRGIKFICSISYIVFLIHHVIIYDMISIVNNNASNKHLLFGCGLIFVTIITCAYLIHLVINDLSKLCIKIISRKRIVEKGKE